MSNTAVTNEIINIEMGEWKRRNLSSIMKDFVSHIGCNPDDIYYVRTHPNDGVLDSYGFVIFGPYDTPLGAVTWDKKGHKSKFITNDEGIAFVTKKVSRLNKKIKREMEAWYEQDYEYIRHHLAKLCGCNVKDVYCETVYPGYNFKEDCGYIFKYSKAPESSSLLGEIRWDSNGTSSDFICNEKNVIRIREHLIEKRKRQMERARAKSVNATPEQSREREVSLGKELAGFVIKNLKNIALTAAMVATLFAVSQSMDEALHPDYVNDSYKAGFQAVNMETHRTQDNQGYWYDYDDIARRYDDQYDFDSWVYGTYNNVGWNQESKLYCMDELFDKLEDIGITEYDSFFEYCKAKGACKEKDGKLVIDAKAFRNMTEEYMTMLNDSAVRKEADDSATLKM